jgi:hypothetical protein
MKHKKAYGFFAVLAALMALLVLGACPSDAAGSIYVPVDNVPTDNVPTDNPGGNAMSRQTAEGIFGFSYSGGGVTIEKFKSAKLLAAWLLQVDAAARVAVEMPDAFTIPTIDNLPVVGIADEAFATNIPGGSNDITTVVLKVVLPETITNLGNNLFAGVKAQVTIVVPPAVVTKLGADNIIASAGDKGVATVAGEQGVVITPDTIAVFSRSSHAGVYTLAAYNGENARLLTSNKIGTWYKITDTDLKALFRAIYEPNQSESVDTVESGKAAIKYTEAISAAALDLFKITIGTAASADKVELKGTDLPNADGASPTNLIVIDIGIPGQTNSGLPPFYIPKDKEDSLGLNGYDGDYSHIRLRVNNGAELVILADNSGYIANGAGNSCPDGNFKGGAVEVLADGKLRDGAFEGFSLGSGAVIVNWAGSYLSIGPEPGTTDATGPAASAYTAYYAGYLIGPSNSDARVEWDDTNGYLEVRSRQLITNAKLTVKKNLGLIYSVWFLSGAKLDINIPRNGDSSATYGLWTNERADNSADYNFYVVVVPDSFPKANFITVTSGLFDKRFLINGAVEFDQSSHIAQSESAFGLSYNNTISARYGTTDYIGYLVAETEETEETE